MALAVSAIEDLAEHFQGILPYYNYRTHSARPRTAEVDRAADVASRVDHSSPSTLRVFTLNAGLILVTPHHKARCAALGSYLNDVRYDIACLQEVCHQRFAVSLIKNTKEHYPYSYFFNYGVGFPFWPAVDGTGLVILSRFPIVETYYLPFDLNGFPWAIHHCDYYGSKGVGFARIALPAQFRNGADFPFLNVYMTHMHAEYNDNWLARAKGSKDEYLAHRVVQGLQLAQFARLTGQHDAHHLQLACGDFNAPPGSVIMGLQTLAGFRDSMEECQHPEPRATFGCKTNFFHSHGKTIPQRVDFILYKGPLSVEQTQNWPWTLVEAHTVISTLSNSPIHLSDHYGVAATFAYDASKCPNAAALSRLPQPTQDHLDTLRGAEDVLKSGVAQGLARRKTHRACGLVCWFVAIFLSVWARMWWSGSVAVAMFFIGVAEFLLCHFVIKDEIKVIQEKLSQVQLMIDSIS